MLIMRDSFNVARFCWDDMAVVTVAGELDMATAPAVRDEVDKALAARAHVIVDVAEVSFCDSAGLRELAGAHDRARAQGDHAIVVAGVTPRMRKLLRVSGLDQMLPCYASVTEALAASPLLAPLPRAGHAPGYALTHGNSEILAACIGCGGDLLRGSATAKDAHGNEIDGLVCLSCDWLDNAERERWLLHNPRLSTVRALYVAATIARLEEEFSGWTISRGRGRWYGVNGPRFLAASTGPQLRARISNYMNGREAARFDRGKRAASRPQSPRSSAGTP